jgi:hypothetical protein
VTPNRYVNPREGGGRQSPQEGTLLYAQRLGERQPPRGVWGGGRQLPQQSMLFYSQRLGGRGSPFLGKKKASCFMHYFDLCTIWL